MKNAVMISIRPKWCELIANGEKTIEIRKNRPKLETPFKCYIYCTNIKYINLDEYVELHRATGGKIDQWHGKVIGEFVCDKIETKPFGNGIAAYYSNEVGTCLSDTVLRLYASKGKPLYFWHISELKIYDEPKELTAFGLKKPPQSWCYVEEMKEAEK